MTIRPERPCEYTAIHDLIKTAFQTAKVSNGEEQNFVGTLRQSDKYIPELALAAEENGALIGHIMFTKLPWTCGAHPQAGLLLAPLCVALPHRGKGIGAALVKVGSIRAKELGHNIVFLVGDPEYYGPLGYKKTTDYGIKNASPIPDRHVMAAELHPGALANKTGSVSVI